MQIKFGVEYRSESSYRLLMRFLGMSLRLPDPSGVGAARRRPSPGGWPRSGTRPVDLLQEGWEVCTVDEVRVEREAETRRMWLPKGKRTRLYVDRKKTSRSFFGALSLTTKKMRIYPFQGDQNAEQTALMMGRLARESGEKKKIAVVLDNTRFHHAKALNALYAPGQALERITPIYMPPLRPRPWVPPSTYGTPPRTISPTSARSPRRTPSRPSPPTSPTAPSTTTSSTSQSHRHTPILFNSSHMFVL